VAATEGARAALGGVVAAALALPGVAAAQADGDRGLVSVRWLDYSDSQPNLDRISVHSPSVLVRTPVRNRWGLEASLTSDRVSGASPRWHTAVSGASRMQDERLAGGVKVTRYAQRERWTLGAAGSDENDFRSRAVSLLYGRASEDNNRDWSLGVAATHDRIGSSDDPLLDERRRTWELAATWTEALTRQDLLQLGWTHAQGQGYYNDPYKRPDLRPDSRRQDALSLRWNHHFEAADVTLRSAWRFYDDSFGVRSQTLEFEPVFTPAAGFSVAPLLRLYTQRAAWFYFDPVYSYLGEPFPPGWTGAPTGPVSADQRLSAFGAVTLGLKLAFEFDAAWSTELRLERYEQRGSWRVGGTGSPGLEPLRARFLQWAFLHRF
jgi:hypothetical protein